MIIFLSTLLIFSFVLFIIGIAEDEGYIIIPSIIFGIIFFTTLIVISIKPTNEIKLNKQKLLEHNLLIHNSKTDELEPVGKLKEIMEEIK